jgi:hypothetical protein
MTAQQRWLLWGAGLSALALMVWGYLFWAVSPLQFSVIKPLPDEDAVLRVFKDTQLSTGVYSFPGLVEGQGMDGAFFEKTRSGPIGQIFIRREGFNPLNPLNTLLALAHFFAVALLAGGILLLVRPALPSYGLRVLLVFALSAFAALSLDFSGPVWWHHPWGFHAMTALYNAGGGAISGLILAWALDPKRLLAKPAAASPEDDAEAM